MAARDTSADDWGTLAALGAILDASPRAIVDYSVRPQTRREHRPLLRGHAYFLAAEERALEPVRGWRAGL